MSLEAHTVFMNTSLYYYYPNPEDAIQYLYDNFRATLFPPCELQKTTV